MAETTKTTPVADSRRIVEEFVDFATNNGARPYQVERKDRTDRWATVRMLFIHPLRYCTNSILSEDQAKPAQMLDVSLEGVGFWCCEALTEGMVVHVCLPLLDGSSAWVKGKVIYCHLEIEHYRAGVAFIFE